MDLFSCPEHFAARHPHRSACRGAGLSQSDGEDHRAVHRRRRRRCGRPHHCTEAGRRARPVRHHRKSRRCGRHARRNRGGAGAARRLHPAGRNRQHARDELQRIFADQLRPGSRFRPGRFAHDVAAPADRSSFAAGKDRQRPDRIGTQPRGRAQLRLLRHRQHQSSRRRAVQLHGENPGQPRALSRLRSRNDGPHRRTAQLHVRRRLDIARLSSGWNHPGIGRGRTRPLSRPARSAHDFGSRPARLRYDGLVRPVRSGRDTQADRRSPEHARPTPFSPRRA